MGFLLAALLALTISAPAERPAQFGWPLSGTPTVTRRFDPPPEPWLPGHRGVDLAGRPGAPVLAAGDGRVAFVGVIAGRGVVSIDHPNGVRTTYEPVTPVTTTGAVIRRGGSIGVLEAGHLGCPVTVEACLHWGARRGETYLDPLSLLGLGRVRLKPLHSAAGAAALRPAARRRRRSRRCAPRPVTARRLPTG
jgi:murein DD-endopeptidase MepM/ murein hydrolase activator NlpD